MKFLSIIETLHPASGGPAECAIQLRSNFLKLGHEVDFLTVDGQNRPWTPEEAKAQKPPLGRARILKLPRFREELRGHFGRYDLMILHGIWTLPVFAMHNNWDRKSPYVVFPHGMLDPYFIDNFPIKHLAKSSVYKMVVDSVLRDAHAVVFTCAEERRLASTSYKPVGGNRQVVRYGVEDHSGSADLAGERVRSLVNGLREYDTLLFLSRIHPKKGIDNLIRAFAQITASAPRLRLIIAGPDESDTVAGLKKLAQECGVASKITWPGPVYGSDKWYLYKNTGAMILPSHMENFGMVVAEALASGQPVLVSDKVNIYDSIDRARAGYTAPNTVAGTLELLKKWVDTAPEEIARMRIRARNLYEAEFRSRYTAEDLLTLLSNSKSADVGLASELR